MKSKSSLSLNKNSVTNGFNIGQCIKVANISLYILAAICFMVYATQNYTHAEGDDEDLGYDIASANASVTVGTACTFTATVDNEHNATIANGIYSTDIGKTTLNTICNDSGGYAVYAIGYTGDEYGATDLTSDISSTYNISTGTNTSGDSSSWAMKLAQEPGTTTATIENGYDNYNIVPDDYTKVASLNTVTDPGSTSSTTGSSISTTYQTYISPTQPAGTYTGKVKYTLVHPSTAPKPEKPKTIDDLTYMQDFATLSEEDKTSVLKSMPYGEQYILKDNRDQKSYYISKLKDNNVWMTQNLDFNIVEGGAGINSANTDVPENWADAGKLADTYNSATWNSSDFTPTSYDPGNLFWNGVIVGNQNNCRASGGTWNSSYGGYCTGYNNTSSTGDSHYHLGNYYNWTAAVAMSNSESYATGQQDANQSICPAGWRLPTESSNKSYGSLVSAQDLSAGTRGNIQNSPTYFVYGENWRGYYNQGVGGGSSIYWHGMSYGDSSAVIFNNNAKGLIGPNDTSRRNSGCSVRCVAR